MAEIEEKQEDISPHGTNASEDSPQQMEKEYDAIRAPRSTTQSRANSRPVSLRSISRVRSQNGYGCDDQDSENAVDAETQTEKDPYEVGWEDGDNDPLNPRRKSKAMKWLIVIICSMASLCV
jgi:hypothetical protein